MNRRQFLGLGGLATLVLLFLRRAEASSRPVVATQLKFQVGEGGTILTELARLGYQVGFDANYGNLALDSIGWSIGRRSYILSGSALGEGVFHLYGYVNGVRIEDFDPQLGAVTLPNFPVQPGQLILIRREKFNPHRA